jgi:DNA-directed RNA polymerase subunit RPC12/RpoP
MFEYKPIESNIDDLTDDVKRDILNQLIAGKPVNIELDSRLSITYTCVGCQLDFPVVVLREDMKELTRYLTCPQCKQMAYILTFGRVNREKTMKRHDVYSIMERLDKIHTDIENS